MSVRVSILILIQVDALRRVHNVGFLVRRLIWSALCGQTAERLHRERETGSIPSRVISKTLRKVEISSLLGAQG